MTVEVVVTGIGLVSASGNLNLSWQNLLLGQSAIKLHQPFLELPAIPLAAIAQTPSQLKTLIRPVVADALIDAGLVLPLPDCGVVIGSSRSQQAQWEKLAKLMYADSPPRFPCQVGDWLETLPNMPAIAAARQIGSTAPVLAPMAACATGIWALAQGFELIQTGQCDRVIAGAIEAPITPLTLAGFTKMGALATTGCYPFDRYREGLVLGEGAAVFVLESAELANRRGASIYGEILGFGLTADAYRVSAPELGGESAIAAVKQCLKRSRLSPGDIDYIHAHGTSTHLNDQNEAFLIRHLFPHKVAVSSTKGSTGHTLGASGALGVAFCLMGLKYQILPPCVGLKEPEFDLDLVRNPRRGKIRRVLCFSFGFGGQNAVVALG